MVDKKQERRGLGRGLSALMADVDVDTVKTTTGRGAQSDLMVPVEQIAPNPDQPRRDFDKSDMEELASSIAEKGVIQPLIVRAHRTGDAEYQIVAGERRWRAAQLAQVHEVPIVIRDFDDSEVLEIAIIENIQRADLNAIEEAMGYRQLQDRFGHTQEQLATALGKSRSHIANLMRLLSLPEDVISWVREGKLSAGHARALITAENPVDIARQVMSKNLSVRETEKLAKSGLKPKTGGKTKKLSANEKDADTRSLEQDLSASLNMRVSINHKDNQENGEMVIRYQSFSQLDDLCRKLSSMEND